MVFFSFVRFGLIGLFLCWSTVYSEKLKEQTRKNEKDKHEIRNIFRHLIVPDEDQRVFIEPMTTVMKSPQFMFMATPELRVREGYLYKGKSTIPMKALHRAVDHASLLDDNVLFQALNPYHQELAQPLYEILYLIDRSQLEGVLDHSKKYLNKYLFHHLLRVVLLHRSDIKTNIPSHVTLMPHLYFEMGDLGLKKYSNKTEKIVLTRKFVDDPHSNDVDHRLEYFRLDPGMNSHHEHWHEANLDAIGYQTEPWSVNRSGEMFYYMHSQMMARYNFERLCSGVSLIEPLDDLRVPLPEPYFEKLTTETRAKLWDSRPPHHKLRDVDLKGVTVKIQQIEMARDRIYDAIDRGFVYINQGQRELIEPLNGPNNGGKQTAGVPFDVGIDKLGYMVWAYENRSVNFRFYGSLHDYGHLLIGNNNDPDGLYHEQSRGSAMSLNYAAPRDPLFYRWHIFVDNIFMRYKSTLPEYTTEELEFKKVVIEDVKVKTSSDEVDVFNTRWVKDTVNITEGVTDNLKNILAVEEVYYDFIHLDHESFKYNITVSNHNVESVKGTIRIFLAPVYTDWKFAESLTSKDEKSKEEALKRNPHMEPPFNDYRRMFIELDKFVKVLEPGTHSIYRKSENSSVTISFKELFKTLGEALDEVPEGDVVEHLSWSGCGWPNYLQIPKGTKEGFPARLFVMISKFEKDKAFTVKDVNEFDGAMSFCGVPDKPNPDKKPMGYPFDRNYGNDDTYLHHFISRNKNLRDPETVDPDRMMNMKVIDVTIKHHPEGFIIGQSIVDLITHSSAAKT